jgi:digeranylgeranylglycerophospholipid reductase
MTQVNSDVIVVGAGPTGSFSALQAAKLGAKVTILEEHHEVGVPSHCTGHISLSGLRRLNLHLPPEVFESEIKSATFHSPSGYRFRVQFATPMTCVVNRTLLDQHLAKIAEEAGATILRNTRVDSLIVEKDIVRGVAIRKRRGVEKLMSKVVIDAEGVSSALLNRAGLHSPDHRMAVNGVQAEVDGIDDLEHDGVEVFLGHNFAPSFFAWIVPRRDGTAKVGLGTAKGNPRDCLRRFVHHNSIVSQRLKCSRIKSVVYHPIPLGGPIPKSVHNGLLVVGDAASHVKPTTGGGVVMGLTCAEIAGKAAADSIRCNDSSAFFLSEYERKWRKKIGFDMEAMKCLRRMLNGFSDRQLDQLIALCNRLKLEQSLKHVGDVDFQGSSLIRIAKSPRTLSVALYLLKFGLHSIIAS